MREIASALCADAPSKLVIGTCAWSFEDWRGVFYPEHLPASERLGFYARHFSSVEIDSTFYHPPAPQVAAHWAQVTPAHFTFSAKMPREITHDRKLRDCESLLEPFLAGVTQLGIKLQCILIQLPPFFSPKHDEHALRGFIRHLPAHIRFAVEFRDPAWHTPRIAHLLEEHRISWVWNDMTTLEHASEAAFGFWPHTTDFLYLRMLGDLDAKYHPDGSEVHLYRELMWQRDVAIENWTEKIRSLVPEVARVLLYVGNQYEGFAPHTAARFAARLGVELRLPTRQELQGSDAQQLDLL